MEISCGNDWAESWNTFESVLRPHETNAATLMGLTEKKNDTPFVRIN